MSAQLYPLEEIFCTLTVHRGEAIFPFRPQHREQLLIEGKKNDCYSLLRRIRVWTFVSLSVSLFLSLCVSIARSHWSVTFLQFQASIDLNRSLLILDASHVTAQRASCGNNTLDWAYSVTLLLSLLKNDWFDSGTSGGGNNSDRPIEQSSPSRVSDTCDCCVGEWKSAPQDTRIIAMSKVFWNRSSVSCSLVYRGMFCQLVSSSHSTDRLIKLKWSHDTKSCRVIARKHSLSLG